jgi:hypothetical protein
VCGQPDRAAPRLPVTNDSLKAKDLGGPAPVAMVCCGDRDVRPEVSPSWQFSSHVPTALERLSTLCRFLI